MESTLGYTFNNCRIACIDCNISMTKNKYCRENYTFLYEHINKFNIKLCYCNNIKSKIIN